MKADVFDLENKKVDTIELPDAVFGAKWNPSLVKQVLLAQVANRRKPWAHVKDRSEIRGGGKKPWRQKGTGRARHGSIRSPLWIGGGKAHGPRSERDYSQKVNKKMKQGALFAVLSKKAKDNDLRVYDSLTLKEPKTKILMQVLGKIAVQNAKNKKFDLMIVPNEITNLKKAGSALLKFHVASPKSLNVYDLLNYKRIYVDRDAVAVIANHYTRG